MLAHFLPSGRFFGRIFAFISLFWIAACDPISVGGDGPNINPNKAVPVALLVPGGSSNPNDNLLAKNLENVARLAIADLNGVEIDLRVYNTAGNPAQASSVALKAVNDGAKIIIGPLYAGAANAAGVSVANRNVNILAFSNNASIAGGNVFVLGPTFENTANRLVRYSKGQGTKRMMVVHAQGLAGETGRDAIVNAARRHGVEISGVESYPLSQQGIFGNSRRIAQSALAGSTDTVFLTAGPESDLPFVATALPEAGLRPDEVKYLGLTRWTALPQTASLPGLQGGYFTLPDRGLEQRFQARYRTAYGSTPHPLAGLAYDGIAAIGALVNTGRSDAITKSQLTRGSGFIGTQGIFRFRADGTNERGLAVAQINNNQVVIVDPAPKSFSGAGF
ncbi:penicillin-binding protein activator [Parasulfitobacter algicola]|uniref:Penicillin-binding protein activator n=1 Tax=Parasulfitobacter algicola TaxID=2614809 RepID=A0ABX2IN09_9RHOB|nr:penicillin-binding protein activator [Sulfitobacter algicola]NSX54267.1 penicillin-binding protein activator [Sulfitobacter algicola]